MAQDYTTDPYNSAHVVATDMGEINNNFAALKSAFSGATTPANTVAGQWWYDTTAHILKVRNETNNAWLSVWDLANNKPVITNLSAEITGAMIAAAIKDAAAGTASLRTLGTGATQAAAGNDSRLGTVANGYVTQAKLASYAAGNVLLVYADKEEATDALSYTKLKEIYIPRAGTVRVKFDLRQETATTGVTVYARIYKNGVAYGTQRSKNNSATYTTYSEDLAFAAGDLIQLCVCRSGTGTSFSAMVRNFRIYANFSNVPVVTDA